MNASTLEELVRVASVLTPVTRDFQPLFKPYAYRMDDHTEAESPERLSARIQFDLDTFHAVEKNAKEYVSMVQGLCDAPTPQRDGRWSGRCIQKGNAGRALAQVPNRYKAPAQLHKIGDMIPFDQP